MKDESVISNQLSVISYHQPPPIPQFPTPLTPDLETSDPHSLFPIPIDKIKL